MCYFSGARGQYVDVLNPKPASSTNQVPSGLFNTLPHTQSAPAIFVPGGAAGKWRILALYKPIETKVVCFSMANRVDPDQTAL